MMPSTDIKDFQALMAEPLRLEAVKAQIEKDFGLAGFEFTGDIITWEALIEALTKSIETIRTRNSSQWMKIVYRVDLTEKQYRFVKALGGDSHENLAKAVVLREFQKVLMRERYSKS